MIVWGGYARSEDVGQKSDGAAYNPTTGAWRTIAPSPPGVQGGAAVVWTGDEMVVWASNSPDGPVGTAAYDPATDSWRRLPAGPLGKRESFSSVWTGKELIVVGGNLGDTLAKPVAAALDPKTGSWRLLPALDRVTGLMPSPGVVWDGHEVFVMGSVCAEPLVVLAHAPRATTRRPTRFARSISRRRRSPPQQQLKLIGVSGSDLVFSTEGLANMRIFIVRYDPTTGSWSKKGAFAPFPVPVGAYTQTAWLGDRYVAADGSSGLQIYSLDTDTWQTITPGPSPLNSREGSAIVWTGSRADRVERHRVRALQPHPGGRRLTHTARLTAAPSRHDPRYRPELTHSRRGAAPSCAPVQECRSSASHTRARYVRLGGSPDARRARRCKPVVSTAVRGGGHGGRQGAATTAMVHQDLLARAPTDRANEQGP